jgi:3D (Asp-Asp-Asp) domain-containing protein
LRAQERRALLSLYAVDTRLHTIARRRASLASRAQRLRRIESALAQQLAAARRTLNIARGQLDENLRVLYKQDPVSALAVVLGAQSIDDAVTGLDSLGRVATQTRSLVRVAKRAQRHAAHLRRSLHAQQLRVAADLAAVARTRQTLLETRAGRAALLTRLRARERVQRQTLDALQQIARRVERKSDALQAAAEPVSAPPGARTVTVITTGYALAGRTSTGMPVGPGVVAVDPAVIPLGSRLAIPGYGDAVAADTGSGVRGAMIDLWFPTREQARAWGRRTVTVTLH